MKVKDLATVVVAAVMGIFTYKFIGEPMIASIDKSQYPSHTAVIIDTLPIILGIGTIIGVVGILAGGRAVYRIYKWQDFGNRLKEAYSAKFGGPNPAFSEEVDLHIKAVRTMGGKSYSKDLNLDWLRRMAEFVEVPWSIPEEEYLSEAEKTEEFGEGKE